MTVSKPFYLFGSGGHAKVVLSLCSSLGYDIKACFDKNPERIGEKLHGITILDIAQAKGIFAKSPSCAFIAIGHNKARATIAQEYASLVEWPVLVHPTAFVDASAVLDEGAMVGVHAIVQPDAKIGAHAIINTASVIEHDCNICNYAHIAPNTSLAGAVEVGEGAFIGTGACVIPNMKIGSWSTVGAGSVVIRPVPQDTVFAGVPARALAKEQL